MSQAVVKETPTPPLGRTMTEYLDRNASWVATAVLLLMFGLALTSMTQKAPTFDEQGFIVRGLGYLRGYQQIRVGHPLGINALNAILLAADESVILPLDDPSWTGSSFHRPAELFLWEIGNDVEHIMFLARLPSIWLGVLLAAAAGRWAWQISARRWVGLLALTFVALDPNILAHARLATTDLGLTVFALLAGYTLWRFLKSPSWGRALLAGVSFGLLQNTKFTAGLFIPLFALVIAVGMAQIWVRNKRSQEKGSNWFAAFPWRPLAMLLIAYPLAALLTLWGTNGFDISTMPADLPLLGGLSGKTLPLAHYLEQFLDIGGRLRVGTPSFLLGQYSDQGWWYYFPVAFLLKTPLPVLILLAWGTVAILFCLFRYWRQGRCLTMLDSAALLLPALGFFMVALTTDINLGYRHILPIFPFLVIFAAAAIGAGTKISLPRRRIYAATSLSIWLAIVTLAIYPDFLSYFNILAGGPNNGWRSLADSNLDWGQDLDDLPDWMAENRVNEIWLSYFGEARPEYYGIDYRGLDSFPPRLMNPQARPFAPSDPAPGIYAISATNLQGVHFTNHDQFAWFREQEPLAKLGNSIFLYEVPGYGEPALLLLSGMQIDEIFADDYALLETNNVTGRWFDIEQSLVLPAEDNVWLARDLDQEPHELLAEYLDDRIDVVVSGPDYELARLDRPAIANGNLADFALEDGRIRLIQAEIRDNDDSMMTVVTAWDQRGDPQPLKIFIHVTGPDGLLVTQWDGLGTNWQGWLSGDTLVQVHTLMWPDDVPEGSIQLNIGLYKTETGQRWLTTEGLDHIQLQE